MTDLQKQIEELEQLANSTDRYTNFEAGIDVGSRNTAIRALSIIKQLQGERDRYKLLWESACEGANAIVAEQEEEIRKLRALSGWRSKDILPEKEITYGILFDGGIPFQAWLVQGIWCRIPKNTALEHVNDFTYWKPLDLPPHLIKRENNDK